MSSKPGVKKSERPSLAIIHNELARSRSEMGVVAMRLVVLLALRAQKDRDFLDHEIRVADYVGELGLQGKAAYAQLEQLCNELLRSLVEIRNPIENSRTTFQVIARAKYWDGEGKLQLRFHEEMRPLLLDLRKNFASVPVKIFFRLKSTYSQKFYLLCRSWRPTKDHPNPRWQMSVEQFRRWLNLKDSEYEFTALLKRNIIDRAQAELDEKADVSFNYTPIKRGTRVIGWTFLIVDPKDPNRKIFNNRRNKIKKTAQQCDDDVLLPHEEEQSEHQYVELPDHILLRWKESSHRLKSKVTEKTWERWFSGISPKGLTDNGKLQVASVNPIHRFYIEHNYSELLDEENMVLID